MSREQFSQRRRFYKAPGTLDQQFKAFEDVVGEFVTAPYPAWTAVGTTGLLSDGGIVEIQLIAHAARK